MALLAYLPIAVFGGVCLAVGIVCSCVKVSERARSRRIANMPRRRRFQPRIIQGGKLEAIEVQEPQNSAAAADKLAG